MLTIFFKNALGLNGSFVTTLLCMVLRGFIIYFFGIIAVRFNKKLFSVHTPFNFILFVILGSILAEAIVSEEKFIAILITIFLMILLNKIIDVIMYYLPKLEEWLKGSPTVLIQNGEIQWENMKKHAITKSELVHELHTNLHINDLNKVEKAYLTTEGTINFVKKE